MAQVLTNREGTYFVEVTSAGELKVIANVSVTTGESILKDQADHYANIQSTGQLDVALFGIDTGGLWQGLHTTLVGGNHLLDVNVAAGAISIDPGDIRIGAVEIQDQTTTIRLRVPLVNVSESYVAGTDAGLLTAFIDENGDFNYVMVDSSTNAMKTTIK